MVFGVELTTIRAIMSCILAGILGVAGVAILTVYWIDYTKSPNWWMNGWATIGMVVTIPIVVLGGIASGVLLGLHLF